MDKKFNIMILTENKEANMESVCSMMSFDVCGKPVISWVVSAAEKAQAAQIGICIGKNEEAIRALLGDGYTYVKCDSDNSENLAQSARSCFASPELPVVVLYGDMPLLTEETILNTAMYQTSNIAFAVSEDANENIRVTDKVCLAEANRIMRYRINARHALNGVTIMDLYQTFIESDVEIAPDAVIYPNVYLKGKTKIGSRTEITDGSLLENTTIGDDVSIKSSYIYDAVIGHHTTVGPFAYVRPGSVIGESCRIGDFVEIKNATIQNGTKVSHLTYVGDADVGERVNFGCGTVTVNYNGASKFRTVIGNDVFLGCNTNLVAPVEVEDGAYIAAGSTITDRVPKDTLAIARARQVIKDNWTKPKKEKK